MKRLLPEAYRRSAWSGGTTVELAIFPPQADYAQRDFLWRVSSASVELEESDFTALPDYDRLIATLEGEIQLSHNGGAPLVLRPLEVHAFSGADATHSRGRCTDFNLMLRRGKALGSMEPLRLSGSPVSLSPAEGETLLLYCVSGAAAISGTERFALCAGQTVLAEAPAALTLGGEAVLMLCRIWLL